MSSVRILALALACLGFAAPAAAEDFGRSVAVTEQDRVHIELEAGDVVVMRHTEPVVRILARARGTGAEAVRFLLDEQDGDLTFRSLREPWLTWLHNGLQVDVRAWVPHGVALDVTTTGRVEQREPGVRVLYPGIGGR